MNNVSFGNIKNTGHDFPQCLSSARHISLEGGAGMWEEIIKELVLSLILWAHLHRAGSWRVSEEPLKCPSPGVSNSSANDSMLAVFEWDTTGQGAWMPSRGTSTQLPPNFCLSQGESMQQYTGKWCLGSWEGRALWVPPSTFNIQFRKKKHSQGGLST